MERIAIEYFMQLAIEEGRKALPDCLPNPPVGCVIVHEGQVIARGYTQRPGEHHAEAMALAQLPDELTELSLFVTLEPCSFQGRTPSCARAIVRRQIRYVYVGIIDPHPRNQGAGLKILQDADLEVETGILAPAIQKELGPYLVQKIE